MPVSKESNEATTTNDKPLPTPSVAVRRMKEEDVDQVLKLWTEIGLHEGTQTIQSFMSVDPEGFAVAVDKQSGKINMQRSILIFQSL